MYTVKSAKFSSLSFKELLSLSLKEKGTMMLEAINNNPDIVFVQVSNTILGWAFITPFKGDICGEVSIISIFVRDDWRCRGIGAKLINALGQNGEIKNPVILGRWSSQNEKFGVSRQTEKVIGNDYLNHMNKLTKVDPVSHIESLLKNEQDKTFNPKE